jgi:hypothetical protein
MATKRITERVAEPFSGVRVDREAGTISGVLVCGFRSANNRTYGADVLRKSVHRYEGRVVNCDHGEKATVERRLGWLSDVTAGDDGRPRATLNVLRSHPMAERVFEAAERNPSLFGMSHVAMCKTSYDRNGNEVVESIDSIESVDLVADPASTKGLHESKGHVGMYTIKKFLESVATKATVSQILKVKKLAEMEGVDGAPMGDLPMDQPPDDMTPEDGISAAFKAAIMSVVDAAMAGETDAKEALGKIKKLLNSHDDINGDGKIDAADVADVADDDDEPDEDEETYESRGKRKGTAILEAMEVAEKHGLTLDRGTIELIAGTSAKLRETLAQKLKGSSSTGEKPRTTQRQCTTESKSFVWQD